jgi:hypothetical protein
MCDCSLLPIPLNVSRICLVTSQTLLSFTKNIEIYSMCIYWYLFGIADVFL